MRNGGAGAYEFAVHLEDPNDLFEPRPADVERGSPPEEPGIQRIRDETHRFAVTFHRQRRDKRTLTSELFAIPGISEKTSKLLLRKFGSAKDLEQTSLEQLSKEIAPRLAKRVYQHFHPGTAAVTVSRR